MLLMDGPVLQIFKVHSPNLTKSKDWLALNQDNVSEWGDMSIDRLFFQ
jgi:hypothetical protein